MDESCLGNPQRAGFGGLIRNNAGFFISGFSGHNAHSNDILLAELYVILDGLQLVRALNIDDFGTNATVGDASEELEKDDIILHDIGLHSN